jgi:hypothetical protein
MAQHHHLVVCSTTAAAAAAARLECGIDFTAVISPSADQTADDDGVVRPGDSRNLDDTQWTTVESIEYSNGTRPTAGDYQPTVVRS